MDDELEAGLHLVAAVAVVGEDLEDPLDRREQVLDRNELIENLRREGGRAQPAPHQDLEAVAAAPVLLDDPPDGADVVDRRRRAVLRTGREGDLEFPRHLLAERIAHQKREGGNGVGLHVEQLLRDETGQGAGGDVPHAVSARLPCRQAGLSEQPHDLRNVRKLHEVELHVLAGRQVTDPRRVPLGDVRQAVQLAAGQRPARDLDPDHLHAGLALPVDTLSEAKGAVPLRRQLACEEAGRLGLEVLDLPLRLGRQRDPLRQNRLSLRHRRRSPTGVSFPPRRPFPSRGPLVLLHSS